MQVVSLSISSLDKSGENLLEGYLGGILNANSSAQFQKSPFTTYDSLQTPKICRDSQMGVV